MVRELVEELNFTVTANQLKIVGTVFRREHDNLILIYELAYPIAESAKLTPATDELEGYDFVKPADVGGRISDYYEEFLNSYL